MMRWKSRCGLSNRLETFFRKTGEIPQRGISPFRSARSFASRKPCPLASSPSCSRNFLAFCYYGFICPAKLVEGISLAGACERDWREHEENFSRNLSVPRQRNTRKRVLLSGILQPQREKQAAQHNNTERQENHFEINKNKQDAGHQRTDHIGDWPGSAI